MTEYQAMRIGYDQGYKDGKEEGRADVIDEILAFLKSKTWDEEEKAYIFNGSVLVPVNVLEDEIKQLREKQNE